jgi:2-keto-4-pentenoate hydratase/2-oxohepta-3-ene-1,7-dioic acid hydratase in catechol pathway
MLPLRLRSACCAPTPTPTPETPMRLCMFDADRVGVIDTDDRLADITGLVGPSTAPRDRMTALIESWDHVKGAVAQAVRAADVPLDHVTVRAPQPRPGKIIAAPVNYRRHQLEMGGGGGVYRNAEIKTIETYAGFIKASSSITGPDGVIELPEEDRRVDHEAEIGVVIGRRARAVSREDAHHHIFGFVPLLDITIRGDEDRSFRKSLDTFTPIGPAIVTSDEVADPENLAFELTVDGELRQRSNTNLMIYGIGRLVEFYSQAMTLEPGDLIATGTPEGVGPITHGQEVVLTVQGIGELTMRVRKREAGAC